MITKLPAGLRASDTKMGRTYKDRLYAFDFELWHVRGWGWCIPTLLIRNAPRRMNGAVSPRSYAVRVDDGSIVRIGLGPHVTERVHIYARKGRLGVLKKYIDLKETGAGNAGLIRDRISSRRARFDLMRSGFGS